jgi:hypothetical protein
LPRELKVDGEGDQVLLRTVVEGTLEFSPIGVGDPDEPLSGCAQLLDLETQPVERLLRRLDIRKLQRDRPPALEGSRKLSVM